MDNVLIGELIRANRKLKKLTQIQLSELAGITQTYLSQIEAGNKEPTINCLKKIATALGLELSIKFQFPKQQQK